MDRLVDMIHFMFCNDADKWEDSLKIGLVILDEDNQAAAFKCKQGPCPLCGAICQDTRTGAGVQEVRQSSDGGEGLTRPDQTCI